MSRKRDKPRRRFKNRPDPRPATALVLVTRVGTPGIEGFDLTGYQLVRCDRCKAECWLSPKSRDLARATGSQVVAVCNVCGGGERAIPIARAVALAHGIPCIEFE